MDDTDKLKALLNDAKTFGVTFEPPDINRGVYRFEPVEDRRVRYGLGAVKGTGQGAIEAIVAAREGTQGQGGGSFRSLFDFCARVDRQKVNKRVVEALIKAGAFDAVHADRATLLASVSLAFDWADTQEANALQGGLFDFGPEEQEAHGSSTQEPGLAPAEPWTLRERLMLEKSALGLYLSGHLFDEAAQEVRQFAKRKIADLMDSREPQLLAGIVTDLRVVNGQRGRACIFKLDDASDAIEAVVNEDLLDAHKEWLVEDALLVAQGRVQLDRFSGGLRFNVQQLWDLPSARARFGKYLAVSVHAGLPPVAEVIRTWPVKRVDTEQGVLTRGLSVRLLLERPQAQAEIDLGEEGQFWPSDEALARWRQVAHAGQASVVYDSAS